MVLGFMSLPKRSMLCVKPARWMSTWRAVPPHSYACTLLPASVAYLTGMLVVRQKPMFVLAYQKPHMCSCQSLSTCFVWYTPCPCATLPCRPTSRKFLLCHSFNITFTAKSHHGRSTTCHIQAAPAPGAVGRCMGAAGATGACSGTCQLQGGAAVDKPAARHRHSATVRSNEWPHSPSFLARSLPPQAAHQDA